MAQAKKLKKDDFLSRLHRIIEKRCDCHQIRKFYPKKPCETCAGTGIVPVPLRGMR